MGVYLHSGGVIHSFLPPKVVKQQQLTKNITKVPCGIGLGWLQLDSCSFAHCTLLHFSSGDSGSGRTFHESQCHSVLHITASAQCYTVGPCCTKRTLFSSSKSASSCSSWCLISCFFLISCKQHANVCWRLCSTMLAKGFLTSVSYNSIVRMDNGSEIACFQ
jgi:hypothetical protein